MKQRRIFTMVFLTACILASCKKKCSLLIDHPLTAYMFITPNVERIKLGDTLKMKLFIPFESYRTDTNEKIDVTNSSLSTSGVEFLTYKKTGNDYVINENNFIIIPTVGSFKKYNNVVIRAAYEKKLNGYVFECLVIPTEKGIAKFVNWKAEGWMNGNCDFNIFSPTVGSTNNNHQLIREFFGPDANGPIPENNYFLWVE